MAAQLHQSLHAKLLTLPAELELFPAHQAGSACGVGLSGKPSSTLGFERRWNPVLSMDRDEFVATIAAQASPPPEGMASILAANKGL
jgi:hypothetical protein